MRKRHGFTIVELVIVVAIIALLMATIIPKLTDTYEEQKENIIDLYNGEQFITIYLDGEIYYQGKTLPDLTGYKMVDIVQKNEEIIIIIEEEKTE